MEYATDPGYESIRTTLESALAFPFTVAVTSSQASDGKTDVAVGTARNFARAGFETLLVDANPLSPQIAHALGLPPIAPPQTLEPQNIAIQKAGGLLEATSIASHRVADDATLPAIRTLAQYFRSKYKVTIVDLSEVFYGTFAVHWAAVCDGVIIAARHGRFADDEDRALTATLEQAGAKIIGCVPTSFPDFL